MIIKNDAHYGNSYKDCAFFKEHYHEIRPIKKISVFFDYENFIFTDYNVHDGTTFVAEGWNGDQIHLTGLNCGYGGEGPSRTAEILVLLGLGEAKASELKYYPGLEIEFDIAGRVHKENIKKTAFFSRQFEHDCLVHLDKMSYVDMVNKELFIVNPQLKPLNIYNIIDKLHPFELQYYIGTQEIETLYDSHIPYENIGGDKVRDDKHIIGVNLILICEKIKVLCLVDSRMITSVVDMLYYYIFHDSLFGDSILVKDSKSCFKSFLLSLSGGRYEKYGVIQLYKRDNNGTP